MYTIVPLNPDDLNLDVPYSGIIVSAICVREVDGCIICESVNPNNHFLIHFKIWLIVFINVT